MRAIDALTTHCAVHKTVSALVGRYHGNFQRISEAGLNGTNEWNIPIICT